MYLCITFKQDFRDKVITGATTDSNILLDKSTVSPTNPIPLSMKPMELRVGSL